MSSHAIPRPLTFLSLAPVKSTSYPQQPALKSPAEIPASEEIASATTNLSRTSSAASTDATTEAANNIVSPKQMKFLKLGPVHWGAGDGDWSEDTVIGAS